MILDSYTHFGSCEPLDFKLGLPSEFESLMKMDEHFIAISTFQNDTTRLYFFSKKTLKLHWRKEFEENMKKNLVYGKGMLLQYVSKRNEKSEEYGVIQVYDVTSRKRLREIRITAKHDLEEFGDKVGFNSKFMVVAQKTECQPPYQINIYDLQAVKNSESIGNELLVHTLSVEFPFHKILMDETAILCDEQRAKTFKILDFSSFEIFQNAAKSVTLSLPWRSVWRSKGVDEEPLDPVRHLEVYREVLKYFHELSLNCQTAIKRYPMGTIGTTSPPDVPWISYGYPGYYGYP
jgi:hypothetical protein